MSNAPSFNSNLSSDMASSYSSVFNDKCVVSYVKFLFITILVISLICCMSSVISMSCGNGYDRDYFTNNEKDSQDLFPYTKNVGNQYQSIPLTHTDTSNLQFGQINRYISFVDKKVKTTFDLNVNLYVLDGNIYQPKDDHMYKVFVFDNNNSKILVGKLTKDGDGLYKLKNQFNDNLSAYKHVVVVYTKKGVDTILLQGTFA